jgi:hypothetical protein
MYQQQLLDVMPFILSIPYGQAVLGQDDVANKLFLTLLFGNKEAGVQFLKDMGLLHGHMARNTCVCHMS